MKAILVANTDWYLYNFRLSLVDQLQQVGYEVVMVSPPGKYSMMLRESGFQWVSWNVKRKSLSPVGEIRAILSLARIYTSLKADIVHHSTMKPVLYGSLAARLLGNIKVVNSVTGLGYVWMSSNRQIRLLRPLVKILFRVALSGENNRIIFENEQDQAFFIRENHVSPEKTHVIPGVGVNSDRFLPSPEPDGKPVILFPARILWDKGVGTLVEAARILKKSHDAQVVLVGESDPGNPTSVEENVIKQWEKEGVIEYWGWKDDMARVYQECHIVVLPSFYEGVPTALLEAASCGRPIVASDIPGCRTIVMDGINGFLVPVNDVQELANALIKLVSDRNLRMVMGAAGRNFILEKFTTQNINQHTIQVYDSLINEK
jgi:glycosyltransferase involved in cell wall biosynthesis